MPNATSSTLEIIEESSLLLLLAFTPLVRGATSHWAFCFSLWVALVGLSAMLLRQPCRQTGSLPKTPLEAPLLILLILAAGSLAGSIYRFATIWALLRLFLYVAAFYLSLDIVTSKERLQRLLLVVIAMGTVIAFLGFIQVAMGTVPFLSPSPGTGSERELVSTFVNHNHLAGYLAMVLMLGLGMILYRPPVNSLVLGGCLLLIMMALYLSRSRGGWISAFIAMGFMAVAVMAQRGVGKFKTMLVVLAVIFVTGFSFLGSNAMIERFDTLRNPNEPSLMEGRVPAWRACSGLIKEHPLLGTGLGTFPWSFGAVRPPGLSHRYREAHNDYVQIVTEVGLPVLIPLVWGLILVFRTGFTTLRTRKSRFKSGVTLGALGGMVAILVHSVGDFNLQITSNGILFAVLGGLVMGTAESSDFPLPQNGNHRAGDN